MTDKAKMTEIEFLKIQREIYALEASVELEKNQWEELRRRADDYAEAVKQDRDAYYRNE